ncbi:hypothetical protein [Polyangium mundeleinium]|uniref:ABC transporter permease n=1 Tax=Polyangium mundeleinium TaxID=2995306 RepID=A0ABT5EXX7_9BACT|nr:hypothetical protein [Polyangium mundeleinium]MDC0746244.1 hypothetical protein [Polyangium mundeleinium]
MSNAPIKPPPRDLGEVPATPTIDEQMPPSGVRKMLDAFEERDLSRIRWSSVLAGLFLALGTLVLLGLLGFATGVSVLDPGGRASLERLGAGMALWMAFASLVALFVGSYAAAKLGGAIRRGDGALAGVLTWAVSLALLVFVVGNGAPPLFGTEEFGRPAGLEPTITFAQRTTEPFTQSFRFDRGELVRAAWLSFAGAVITLLAATFGGALGAVGRRRGSALPPAPRPSSGDQIPMY